MLGGFIASKFEISSRMQSYQEKPKNIYSSEAVHLPHFLTYGKTKNNHPKFPDFKDFQGGFVSSQQRRLPQRLAVSLPNAF